MSEFTDFERLYSHLEEKALDYKHPQVIGTLFQELRDLKHKQGMPAEAEKAQWELDFFNFVLKAGEIHPTVRGTDDKGQPFEYPNLERFDETAYAYLIERSDSTKNVLLKARYSHILWCSRKKRTQYAEIAVDSYLDLIKVYEQREVERPEELYGLDLYNVAENAYCISTRSKYKVDTVRSEFRRLISGFDANSNMSFHTRANLIDLMLKDKKTFLVGDFEGFDSICVQASESLSKQGNLYGCVEALKIGEKVANKLGLETETWAKRIAQCYEELMRRAKSSHNIVSLDYCRFAHQYYRRIGDRNRVQELERQCDEIKKSIQFQDVGVNVDLTEEIELYKAYASTVTQGTPVEIIDFLIHDQDILPKFKDMKTVVEENKRRFPLQHLLAVEFFDDRGLSAQHFDTEEERSYHALLSRYALELKLGTEYLIREIFVVAIRQHKLTSKLLLDFLANRSWLGKTVRTPSLGNRAVEYRWLDLLAPAVRDYFQEMEGYLLSPSRKIPTFVLSIDSLSVKIEGILRDICRFQGIPTSFSTNRKGKTTEREKGIQALLSDEQLKTILDEDHHLFFNFLLVEQVGYNLRHRVAHTFLTAQEYQMDFTHLLLLAVLKLTKYDFTDLQNKQSDGAQ